MREILFKAKRIDETSSIDREHGSIDREYIEHEKNFVILLSMINTFFAVKKLEEMKKNE